MLKQGCQLGESTLSRIHDFSSFLFPESSKRFCWLSVSPSSFL